MALMAATAMFQLLYIISLLKREVKYNGIIRYQTEMDNKTANEFWGSYFTQEKAIYEQILADPDTVVKGTVKELADKYGVEVLLMTGFLDGINDSLKTPNPIETMEEDTEVSLDYDKEKLYYNMVACKADWLYHQRKSGEVPLSKRHSQTPPDGHLKHHPSSHCSPHLSGSLSFVRRNQQLLLRLLTEYLLSKLH